MIDTLKVTRSPQRAGFEGAQAEAVAVALSDATAITREDLTTKADLKLLAAELRSERQTGFVMGRTDLAKATVQLEAKIADSRAQMCWVMLGSQVGLFAALMAVARFTDLLR